MTATDVALEPPPELRYRHRSRLLASLRELARSRELVFTLSEREFRARYKQAALGVAWAVVTPLAMTLVFTLFLKRVTRIDTGDVPYPLFSYLGLMPWGLVSAAISRGGLSIVTNNALINKVYCPREVFPVASVAVALIDMMTSALPLAVLFVAYGRGPTGTSWWLVVLIPVLVALALGVALVLSAVLVYVRDLRHALPIFLQLAIFATPVAYGLEAIPRGWWKLYAALNPAAPLIDGFRRTMLQGLAPRLDLLGIAAASSAVFLAVGYAVFKRLEVSFADVA